MNLETIHNLRKQGKKIGITFSQFDLIHAGHTIMLAEAKTYCDYLICGLHNNASIERSEKNSPVQSIVERQLCLSSIRFVDQILVYNSESDLEDILLTYPIDVRIIGSDYKNREFTGKSICKRLGIQIVYNKREHNFSSSELRNRIKLK